VIDLKAKPFYLSDSDIEWVEKTIEGMTLKEKVGQLFAPLGFSNDSDVLKHLVDDIGIGGIMYRAGPAADVQETLRFLQENSKIPLLTGANLEAGGSGAAVGGTTFGKPMQIAATDNEEMGYRLGKISCVEGSAVGVNWSFAPIIDIDMNFRNPITNLRTFGSNPDTVIKMAKGYQKAADEYGMAVSIKHYPGDGVDERDQHLLTSVNSLSTNEWDKTFGRVYSELIEAGAKTVMVGHITQPAYSQKLRPGMKPQECMPATLAPELLNDLLRDKLGFNGMLVTDASQMLGFTTAMPREKAVPASIAAGCDMFLFNKSIEEDFEFMMNGVKNGTITPERLNEALTRILGLKASLKLNGKAKTDLVPPASELKKLSNDEHIQWAKECADQSVTLIKDTQNLLPLNPKTHKKLYLNLLDNDIDVNSELRQDLKRRFEAEGFDVTIRNRDIKFDRADMSSEKPSARAIEVMKEMSESISDFKEQFDVAVYFSNFETASNNTVIRIGWKGLHGMGNDSPWFTSEIPALFVSLANPYHLLDVPMIKTFINAYTNTPYVIDSVVEKLMGRSEFKGKSPVDAFCGREDTKF